MRRFTDDFPYRRTVKDIEEKITKKGKRNLLSRLVNAKDDKEIIGAWKSDLTGILHIFNVRSVRSVPLSLTPTPISDSADSEHKCDRFRYPAERGSRPGRYRRQASPSKHNFLSTNNGTLTIS